MAINFSGYASNYAGGGAPGGRGSVESNAGAAVGQGIAGIAGMIPSFGERYTNTLTDKMLFDKEAILAPVMEAYTGNIEDADFNTLTDSGSAYMSFNTELQTNNPRMHRKATRRKLLNNLTFKQSYDSSMNNMAPEIVKKLIAYKVKNKKSDSEMREFIASKGMGDFLLNYAPFDPTNKDSQDIRDWATPQETLSDQWSDFKSGLPFQYDKKTGWGYNQDLSLGGAALATGVAASSPLWAPMVGKGVWKGGKWVASKGAKNLFGTPAKYIKNAAVNAAKSPLKNTLGVLPPFILSKTVGQIGKGIASSLGGSDTTNKLAQEGTEIGMTVVLRALQKHGVPKVMSHVVKKLGAGVAFRTLGKIGLGALGSGATYGIGTGVMLAWTAKDLYDIYNIIQDMD